MAVDISNTVDKASGLKWVATVGSGKNDRSRVISMNESVQLKGGEKFITFTLSDAQRILGHEIEKAEDGKPILTEVDLDKLGAVRAVEAQLDGLSPRNRRRMIKKMKREIAERRAPIAREMQRSEFLRKTIDAMEEMEAWVGRPHVLERPSATRFHKFMEDARANETISLSAALSSVGVGDGGASEIDRNRASGTSTYNLWSEASVFVVEHNWGAAFTNAKDYVGGEFKLPDDLCAFEFSITGMPIIALVHEDNGTMYLVPCIGTSHGWIIPHFIFSYDGGEWTPRDCNLVAGSSKATLELAELVKLLGTQVRAIAIALEAEVAKTDIIRAPHKLNHQRERRGKLPIFDYHVVSLARRTRAEPLPRDPNAEPGTHKRMHFVRGHWRHFENSKTWVKWHLRGDPDLGFIDKHYKL